MLNTRYSIQLDNADKLEFSTSIQESICSMNKKYGEMSVVKIHITDSEITIRLGNDNPLMAKAFLDYMSDLRDEVAIKVAEKGYHFDKWKRIKEYLVLRYTKGIEEKKNSLIQFVKDTISSVYAEYGQTSTAKVTQTKHGIQIWFDSERPYLDKAFSEFLDKVRDGIDGKLKEEGFVYQKTVFWYDFIVWDYQYDK